MTLITETCNGFHPAVQLMLARMETHPEEFRPRGFRWETLVATMLAAASPEEAMALTRKLNRFRMDALHEQLMAELLDGNQKSREGRTFTIPVGLSAESEKALMSYRNAADPPKGMGNALRGLFK